MDRLKKAHGEFNTYLLENFIAFFWHVCVFYFFGGGSAAGQINFWHVALVIIYPIHVVDKI